MRREWIKTPEPAVRAMNMMAYWPGKKGGESADFSFFSVTLCDADLMTIFFLSVTTLNIIQYVHLFFIDIRWRPGLEHQGHMANGHPLRPEKMLQVKIANVI